MPANGDFDLAAGEDRIGVDIILDGDVVEVTGTVEDVGGGPIGGALISVGLVSAASADGYAEGVREGRAPGRLALYLVPQASITGVVVDAATRAPLVGVPSRSRCPPIDGHPITGYNRSAGWALLSAPPGTRIALGLARGVTVTVTLATRSD